MKMKMTMLITLYLLNRKPSPVCFSNCVHFLHIKWLLDCVGNLGIVFEHHITYAASVHNDADNDNEVDENEDDDEDDNVDDRVVSAKS